jgi:hypothetical protein
MNIFCLEDFKVEFDKLSSKNAYKSLQKDLIDYFFDKSIDQLYSGTRLNNSAETPYIKKRISGSGGFRIYFLLIIRNENVYLMFVHPKTGPDGSENITDQSKAYLYKKVLACITNNDLYQLTLNKEKNSILFSKAEPEKYS